ncbi:hypothetical protein VNI00_010569 [Paramarasmius palmivorus]|uniref:Uncharacterized protein n=1 Tax=Paramarasmius palmivorus TaxID=297713 RepID=A0AAW0CKG7_9AGAR
MSPPQTGRRGTIEHPTRASAVRPNYTSSTKKRTTLHAKPLKSPSSVQTSSRQQQVLGEKEKGQGIGRDPSRDSASTIMSRASEHESKAPGTCSLPKFDADTTRHVKLFATKECLKQQIVSAGPNQGTKDSSRRSMDRERADGEPSRPKVPRVVASPARQPPWR